MRYPRAISAMTFMTLAFAQPGFAARSDPHDVCTVQAPCTYRFTLRSEPVTRTTPDLPSDATVRIHVWVDGRELDPVETHDLKAWYQRAGAVVGIRIVPGLGPVTITAANASKRAHPVRVTVWQVTDTAGKTRSRAGHR